MSRAVRMTRAEAEALLGRKIGRTERGEGEVAASPPRVRRTASGPYHTVCKTEGCDTEFHTTAAEDRHVKETGHANYRLVLGYTFVKPNANCRSCGAPIVWAVSNANNRAIPLDPEPVSDGNIWVDRIEGGRRVVNVALSGDAVPRAEALRYQAHFVSCPQADEWRRRR